MNRYEFLMDEIAFYSADTSRRAKDVPNSTCRYRVGKIPTGKACAIGRYIPNHKYETRLEGYGPYEALEIVGRTDLLPLGERFLSNCQHLHDNDDHWDKDGLTITGHRKIDCIINRYLL